MQRSRWAILWAVVLILGGGLLLAQNFKLLGQFEAPIWTFIFGGVGVLFLLDFITAPSQDWWALIPGCVLLGVAATIMLAEREVKGEWVGSVMLFSIALPFLLIYLVKRGDFWWALIPGGIMLFIAIIPILTLGVRGEAIGTFVLWAIALPFWVVYLINRRNWWAIIPAGHTDRHRADAAAGSEQSAAAVHRRAFLRRTGSRVRVDLSAEPARSANALGCLSRRCAVSDRRRRHGVRTKLVARGAHRVGGRVVGTRDFAATRVKQDARCKMQERASHFEKPFVFVADIQSAILTICNPRLPNRAGNESLRRWCAC